MVLPEPALRRIDAYSEIVRSFGSFPKMGMMGLAQILHGMDDPFSQKAGTAEPSLSPSSGKGETIRLKMFHTRPIDKQNETKSYYQRAPHAAPRETTPPPQRRSPTTEFQSGSIHPVTSHPNEAPKAQMEKEKQNTRPIVLIA